MIDRVGLVLIVVLGLAALSSSQVANIGTSGTVTTFSVTTANGVSASVLNPTTTPAATFTLGAITPTSVSMGSILLLSNTAPTITSGFNTSPSITGTAATFSVGTGTTAATNTAVIGLPTASNGWNCNGQDLSDGGYINQTASTTTSASFKYYSRTTGLAINWPASVTLSFDCHAR